MVGRKEREGGVTYNLRTSVSKSPTYQPYSNTPYAKPKLPFSTSAHKNTIISLPSFRRRRAENSKRNAPPL